MKCDRISPRPASTLICALTNALTSLKDNPEASQKVGAQWGSLGGESAALETGPVCVIMTLKPTHEVPPPPSVSLFAQWGCGTKELKSSFLSMIL